MKIFGLHILTDNQLKQKISEAKSEQRQVNKSIMSRLLDNNVKLAHGYKVLKGSKR